MSNIFPRWSLNHCHNLTNAFFNLPALHLNTTRLSSLLVARCPQTCRNAASLAFKPPLILIQMPTCIKDETGWRGWWATISSSASLWKINERAERVNGKQTWAVIKALVVTCEWGEVGGWEAAVSARPLERCPRLSGLVSVVVCLFVFTLRSHFLRTLVQRFEKTHR